MNDWLKVYDNVRNNQGSVIKAREIVVGLIVKNEKISKERAQDLLSNLINERVRMGNEEITTSQKIKCVLSRIQTASNGTTIG